MGESVLLVFACHFLFCQRKSHSRFPVLYLVKPSPLPDEGLCLDLAATLQKHIAEKFLEFLFWFKSSPVASADGDAGQNPPLLCFFCRRCNKV